MTIQGHADVGIRLNLRREVRRIRRNPLEAFLRLAFPKADNGGTRARYEEAYWLYALAMERALEQVSTAVRFRKGPYYVLKFGGAYGPRQRALAQKRRRTIRFLELDIITCVVQTRILLDRTIGLARVFLVGPQLPSFTSFGDHKKFFAAGGTVPGHDVYANYMCNSTSWFDVPIKFVRDKLVVHQGPRHTKYFGIPGWGIEDDLVWYFHVNDGTEPKGQSRTPRYLWQVRLNVWRLSYDIEAFLQWFGNYGIEAVRQRQV